MDSIAFSEYMIITGIILMIANLIASIFKLFFRPDALYISGKTKTLSNVLLIFLELLFISASIVTMHYDNTAIAVAPALFAIAITFSALLILGFVQMRGISALSMRILERLVGVIEAGDENLDGHSLHVQNLTMLIYDHLPFSARLRLNPTNLEYASLLLDIGKLGIPRSIIHKAGKLSKDERELIQKHPEICMEIFSSIDSLKTITLWIKYHHERVDGSGYYHLTGKEIPLASRILAVADTYSAITMDRSYRPSLPYENAISELHLVAGKQLDEELVNLFCSIPKSKIEACMNDVRDRMKKYQSGTFR
ncbi:MAG: HD domain-containing protein [Treponema sp.]|nr:HD domain-containing protein [Treponema sp.]